MNTLKGHAGRKICSEICALTPTTSFVHSSKIDVSTAPMGCECALQNGPTHKATELGLTWHASFIGTLSLRYIWLLDGPDRASEDV